MRNLLYVLILSMFTLVCHGQVKISQYPPATSINVQDDFIVNIYIGGGSYQTKRTALTNILNAVELHLLTTNINVGTFTVTNQATFKSNVAIEGSAIVLGNISVPLDKKITGPHNTANRDVLHLNADSATITNNATIGGNVTADTVTVLTSLTAPTFTATETQVAETVRANKIVGTNSVHVGSGGKFVFDKSAGLAVPEIFQADGHIVFTAGTGGGNVPLGIGTGASGITITTGTGTPEGVVEANPGSLHLRLDGGPTTTLYVKTSGTTSTGWTQK